MENITDVIDTEDVIYRPSPFAVLATSGGMLGMGVVAATVLDVPLALRLVGYAFCLAGLATAGIGASTYVQIGPRRVEGRYIRRFAVARTNTRVNRHEIPTLIGRESAINIVADDTGKRVATIPLSLFPKASRTSIIESLTHPNDCGDSDPPCQE